MARLTITHERPSLTEVLEQLGWRHEPTGDTFGFGRVVFDDRGARLGRMTASVAWCELHARGLIAFECGHVPRGYRLDGSKYPAEVAQ